MVVAAPCSAIAEVMRRMQIQRRIEMLLKDKVAVIYGRSRCNRLQPRQHIRP
jgi:hypothetical protein